MVKITNSAEETINLGKRFVFFLKKGDTVILEGSLGAGKTTFIKGIVEGFGCKRKVLSPSFTILRQYKTKGVYIYHLDLYRLNSKDIFSSGLEEYINIPEGITLIEWGGKIKEILLSYINVEFFYLGENKRKIVFSSKGRKGTIKL
jgi:tRNA threonylcarbamoyladenosine biosynthesis protein TsaE